MTIRKFVMMMTTSPSTSLRGNAANQANSAVPQAKVLALDEIRITAAKSSLNEGAVIPNHGRHCEAIVKLLNDALVTELVYTLRYKRHHFIATGLSSPAIAEEFMVPAHEESAHADLLAKRIVQLGGEPNFSPDTLLPRSHAAYDESNDLQKMVKANLIAERVAIQTYRRLIQRVAKEDATTRSVLEHISEEEEHADELSDWLER